MFYSSVDQLVKDSDQVDTKLAVSEICYNFVETLRSTLLSNPSHNVNGELSILSGDDGVKTFTHTIMSLYAGSKYDVKVKVKNSLNDLSFSEFSDISRSDYTNLPDSNSYVIQ